MQAKTINELQLLAGLPCFIPGVGYLQPLRIRDIAEIGEDVYNRYLSSLCFELKDVGEEISSIEGITTYDVLALQCLHHDDLKEMVLSAFTVFFGESVKFNEKYVIFYLGELSENRFITRDNYEFIRQVLRKQNFIPETAEEDYNPANERARKLIEEIKKNQRNAPKNKDKTLYSIISGIAWKSHIGIKSVWDLTIYQLFDAYYRLELVDAWDKTMTGIYSGSVDGKKVNLKDLSWSKPIKFNN